MTMCGLALYGVKMSNTRVTCLEKRREEDNGDTATVLDLQFSLSSFPFIFFLNIYL